ncbi:carnitine dehydratase [Frankia sp. R43]|uniref:CoA transferase n=1 Tax=Frankia sp. R43 TaxID=269536 RepID=UPI0006CA3CE5|nr:CoA transferase [Frankia sp. R43]KPM51680.1 carnitine dehydratase [Frankia sp. R43]
MELRPIDDAAALSGLRVVDISLGTSAVGSGLASNLPGVLLRDLGAEVTRVRSAHRSTLDTGVDFERVWQRGTTVIEVDHESPEAAPRILALAAEADVVFLSGPEELLEGRGIGYAELAARNPRTVVGRVRPTHTARGPLPDLELLVAARAGLPTQIRGHRGGPAFPDLAVASAGAGLAVTVGALATLYERETTGVGGWVETSLADGLRAILPMIIGRVEVSSPATDLLWRNQGPADGFAYRCADGDYIQLWFGAKGAYEAFLQEIGDEPSEKGYTADLVSGALTERGRRWAATFATAERADWLDRLSRAGIRCEPVLRPGEALTDPHVRETGLSVTADNPDLGPVTVLGPVARVTATSTPTAAPADASYTGGVADTGARPGASTRLLSGVRVLDLAAYLAGPVTAQVLGDLGADVVKVEPMSGDVHRSMEPMFAAGQRGKRAVAVDLKAPGAAQVLEGLFRWSHVLHHNARVGLADRLGYDEATVRMSNPDVVYSHSSGFGPTGPRALLPANDHLMQALSGVEAGQGGADSPPTFMAWGAIDVTGGWLSACAVIAALYARKRSGAGQSVSTSLLGSALTLKSGAYVRGGTAVGGPVLDGEQTGYGAAYRLYQAGDGEWFALAVPDAGAWERLRQVVAISGLPDAPPPLRRAGEGRQDAERLLEEVFQAEPAEAWVRRLTAADVPVEAVAQVDRRGFVARVLDDPLTRQSGRVASFDWGARGRTETPGCQFGVGPTPRPTGRPGIPGLGEHTAEVLAELGFDADARAALAACRTVRSDGRDGIR